MREMSSADMISLIINRAKTSEKIAFILKNLKGNFKRYIREGAGMQSTATAELVKRVNASGDAAKLKEENLLLGPDCMR